MDSKWLVMAACGGTIGIVVGYAIYTSGSKLLTPFGIVTWLTNPNVGGTTEAAFWAICGAAVATGLRYVVRR